MEVLGRFSWIIQSDLVVHETAILYHTSCEQIQVSEGARVGIPRALRNVSRGSIVSRLRNLLKPLPLFTWNKSSLAWWERNIDHIYLNLKSRPMSTSEILVNVLVSCSDRICRFRSNRRQLTWSRTELRKLVLVVHVLEFHQDHQPRKKGLWSVLFRLELVRFWA